MYIPVHVWLKPESKIVVLGQNASYCAETQNVKVRTSMQLYKTAVANTGTWLCAYSYWHSGIGRQQLCQLVGFSPAGQQAAGLQRCLLATVPRLSTSPAAKPAGEQAEGLQSCALAAAP